MTLQREWRSESARYDGPVKTGSVEEGLANCASASRMAGVDCGKDDAHRPGPRVDGASTSGPGGAQHPAPNLDAETNGYGAGLLGHGDFGRRAFSGGARVDWWRGYRAGVREKSTAASGNTFPGSPLAAKEVHGT